MKFTWDKIASIIGVSRSTLYRRLEEEGISTCITYSSITDNALDDLIHGIKMQHPHDGERLMIGHLSRHGIRVPRTRLRASIHRVDPVNTALRQSITIRRRRYHSDGPNAVWHIDGNHKMIRWHLIIHGGIDGFSRTIVFLKCSDNNRATTLLDCFTKATQMYDMPHKVRTDCGGENTEIWRTMIQHYSSPSAVLTGSSVHNERIERLWRDVTRSVSSVFIEAFHHLEGQGKLDPLNRVDVFCLHYVYLPLINKTLEEFMESWNNHPLSTEHNYTPTQLYCQGVLQFHPFIPQSSNNSTHQIPSPHDIVTVSLDNFHPCVALTITLQAMSDNSLSIDMATLKYSQLTDIVGHHLSHGCDTCA